jgi:hypothetical protein
VAAINGRRRDSPGSNETRVFSCPPLYPRAFSSAVAAAWSEMTLFKAGDSITASTNPDPMITGAFDRSLHKSRCLDLFGELADISDLLCAALCS